MKKKINIAFALLLTILMVGCTSIEEASVTEEKTPPQEVSPVETNKNSEKEETINDEQVLEENLTAKKDDLFAGYKRIEVDGGDVSGYREANVVVDVGYGEREYWAFTNEYGQLVRVIADEIILQDDRNEHVLDSGRYYSDEAKVPGVEKADLDEGHVIADSLGGVSNAYNITPQNSTLNRHGDQAYMEEVIRKAGGATNFEAIITYPNTNTQIPSNYKFTYTLYNTTWEVNDSFPNKSPNP